jgi:putative CocE/NonD family hydrolase
MKRSDVFMTMRLMQQVIADYDVPAEMRDGTILRANVYRPAGEGRWPVLLMRFPYGKDLPGALSLLTDPVQTARRGYVVIVQDTRGCYASEGEWDPFRNEALDTVDTIEWAAKLDYSDGSVSMYGASYGGFVQWQAAVHQPTALKTMIPLIAWRDPFDGVLFRDGALELGLSGFWNLRVSFNVVTRRHVDDPDPYALGRAALMLTRDADALGKHGYWSLPLKEFLPLQRNDVAPFFFETVEYPMNREHAERLSMVGKHEQVGVPTFNIGGWYDVFLKGTIENFKIMREHGNTPQARQSKLLIGPWTHGGLSNPIGEANFGLASTAAFIDMKINFNDLQLRWFDHWLKGIDTGMLQEAPIKIFVMGANVWRDEQEWPLARAVETRYYLHSGGRANTLYGDGVLNTRLPGDEPPDQYDYDPANPVLTRGGALLMSPEFPAGVFDQRATEGREDVLVYTTPVLEEDVEVTGPIRVHLWAVTNVPDTDFVARLVDVYPDGYAHNLTDGIIRVRYRHFEQGEASALIEPGKAYEYEIDLWATSNVFKKDHRIRLDVTSSNFPRWDRNPNTGHEFGVDGELAVAHQTILHDRQHPSFVLLPVVPVA